MAETSTKQESKSRLTPVWVITTVFCGLAIYVVIKHSDSLREIDVTSGKLVFQPGGLAAPGNGEKLAAIAEQVKLGVKPTQVVTPTPATQEQESAIRRIADEVEEDSPKQPAQAGPAAVEGVWRDPATGANYHLTPAYGGYKFTEYSNLYGVPLETAVGQGRWNGKGLEISYNTLIGTQGAGVLEMTANGSLSGRLYDVTSGTETLLNLIR